MPPFALTIFTTAPQHFFVGVAVRGKSTGLIGDHTDLDGFLRLPDSDLGEKNRKHNEHRGIHHALPFLHGFILSSANILMPSEYLD